MQQWALAWSWMALERPGLHTSTNKLALPLISTTPFLEYARVPSWSAYLPHSDSSELYCSITSRILSTSTSADRIPLLGPKICRSWRINLPKLLSGTSNSEPSGNELVPGVRAGFNRGLLVASEEDPRAGECDVCVWTAISRRQDRQNKI